MVIMEEIAVTLAGEMRLIAAIPHLISKLQADRGDILNEQCMYSLEKIGSLKVAEAVYQAFASSWEFRLYAAPVLENNRSAIVGARALSLYRHQRDFVEDEEDALILTSLLMAGLDNFDFEAIEPARQFLLDGQDDDDSLRDHLVGSAVLMGVSFPELEAWTRASHQARKELESTDQGNVAFHVGAARGKAS